MGLWAGELLGISVPQTDKRLLAIVETDGCAVDGIAVATGCRVGRRTMRIEDYGKVAATFVDTRNSQAVRITPRTGCRQRARDYAPQARSRWEAQLLGYQLMPTEELLSAQSVQLKTPLAHIIGRDGERTLCDVCGEEIINQRQVMRDGATLCRSCAGASYYHIVVEAGALLTPLVATSAMPSSQIQLPGGKQ
jgi:formylmethanofuran dehydrogenase subunit E